jgi:hypothetical protein
MAGAALMQAAHALRDTARISAIKKNGPGWDGGAENPYTR